MNDDTAVIRYKALKHKNEGLMSLLEMHDSMQSAACEIDRLRGALQHLSLYVAANGDPWVQDAARAYLAGEQPPPPLRTTPSAGVER